MSHNIVILGYGMFPWQTPTEVTRDVLERCRGRNALEADLHAIELLRVWLHETGDPPPLQGKDARNPHLVAQREERIAAMDESVDRVKRFIEQQGGARRLVCSN